MSNLPLEMLNSNYSQGSMKDTGMAVYYSICNHLIRLLNARRGSLRHMPDYGLPNIAEIYRDLPYSIERLKQAMVETIKTYEPRLDNVRIVHQPMVESDSVLILELSGQYKTGERMQFMTYFKSGGEAEVRSTTL